MSAELNQVTVNDRCTTELPERTIPGARIRLSDIKRAVCKRYGLTEDEIAGPYRERMFAWPRQLAMALSRDLTGNSYPAIGKRYGGRDHTTVLYACRRVRERCASMPMWAEHYHALKTALEYPPANDVEPMG